MTWRCKCECGNTTNVLASNLTTGNTQSCGECGGKVIIQRDSPEPIALHDKFGWLTVTDAEPEIDKNGYKVIWCDCACGNPQPKFYKRADLTKGRVRSCGECNKYKWPLRPLLYNEAYGIDRMIQIARSHDNDLIVNEVTGEVLWQHERFPMSFNDLPFHYQLKKFDVVLHVPTNELATVVDLDGNNVRISFNLSGEFQEVDIVSVILIGRKQ